MSKIKLSYEEAKEIRRNFGYILTASFVTILVGMIFLHHIEKWSYLDSLYFSIVSLTTVGYGDYSPQTSAGKIFVMIYLIVGIAIVATLVNNLVRSAMARRVIKTSDKQKDDQQT